MRRTRQHDDEMQVVDSSQYNQHDEDGTTFDHSIVPDLVIEEAMLHLAWEAQHRSSSWGRSIRFQTATGLECNLTTR